MLNQVDQAMEARERVARGVKFLDEKEPHWEKRIEIHGRDAAYYGFDVDSERGVGYVALQKEWKKVITERQTQ